MKRIKLDSRKWVEWINTLPPRCHVCGEFITKGLVQEPHPGVRVLRTGEVEDITLYRYRHNRCRA